MRNHKNLTLGFEEADEYILDSYLTWLGLQVGVHMNTEENYSLLAKCLHSIEYYWYVPNDDNRGFDGQNLRQTFVDTHNYGPYQMHILNISLPKCSVLEMLIALSMRIEFVMDIPEQDDIVGRFFWEMLTNVGLNQFSDFQYLFMGGNLKVRTIILNVLDRKYNAQGIGGFFPVPNTTKDQRQVEIWYQMHEYLNEKYCIEC